MLRTITSSVIKASSNAKKFQRAFSTLPEFEEAKEKLKKLSEEPDNETKLKLYALFKQATSGNVQGSRPSAFDFINRAKWDSWKLHENTSKEDAQREYAQLINKLSKTDTVAPTKDKTGNEIEGLKITVEDKIYKIELNRPTKFNAITWEMYEGLIAALNNASKDRTTSITVLTGAGNYYCSGNDLSNFMKVKSPADMTRMVQEGSDVLKRFVAAFIDHDKPLIGLINGPAIGISVTVLALFDLVVASDRATFHTPFASLGQSAEGCSTYTFPLLMGIPKASEFLLFGRKLTAIEAYERNLVTQVIPDTKFREETTQKIKELSELPPQALRLNKILLRDRHREELHRVNERECKLLGDRWQSQECLDALKKFMGRKQ